MSSKMRAIVRSSPFTFDHRRMRWSFAPAGRDMSIEHACSAVTVNGRTYRLDTCRDCTLEEDTKRRILTVRLAGGPAGFDWQMRFSVSPDGQRLTLDSEIVNRGSETLIIGQWKLVSIEPRRGGRLEIGPDPANSVVFRQQFWNTRAQRLSSDKGQHCSQFIGLLHNPASCKTFSANFITVDRIVSEHHFRLSGKAPVIEYDASCMLRNHELPPGGRLAAETLVLGVHDDPHAPLHEWARALQRRYNPVLNPKTTVGWLGWSWVDSLSGREQTPEAVTIENAAAMRRRLKGFDIDYIWFSQVNMREMIPGNWLEFDKRNFPHGFEKTLKKLIKMKFKPGLWIAPFWMFKEAEHFNENLPNMVRSKKGIPLSSEGTWEFTRPVGGKFRKFHFHFLDGSHPGTAAFMRKVFLACKRMGVRYYMLDFLGCGIDRTVWDKSKTWTRADRDLMESVRKAAGRGTHLLSAVGTTPSFTGCVDAGRVNTDFGEGRPLHPRQCLHNATYIVNDAYFGNIRKFLQNAASTWFTHRKLWINDYNLLTIDRPVPRNIAEIAVTVFGMSGSPIMLGDDIRKIDEERLRMIKLCMPRTDAMAEPLDLFTNVQPESYARLLALPVKTDCDDYLLLAAFNLDGAARRETLSAKLLGLNPGQSYRIYDFWNEQYTGCFKGELSTEIPADSCKLYRISRARAHPWLLSTNMHIQQGNVEVTKLEWNSRKMTLSGRVTRPRGERGSLYFIMPNDYMLVNHEQHWLMKVGLDNSVVIRRDFEFTKKEMPFELRFAPLPADARRCRY